MRGTQNSRILFALLLTAGFLAGCDKEKPAGNVLSADTRVPAQKRASAPERGSAVSDLSVRILPEGPTARDDLRMVVSGAEGSIHCRWERNGQELSPEDHGCLPEGNYRKGDRIEVTVTSAGASAVSSVTIGNSPPKVILVPFDNPRIHRGVDIVALPEGMDPDGDTVSFLYHWKINGDDQPWIEGPVLSGDQFAKGDRISLTVVPFDGEVEGQSYHGQEFVIPNAPPHFVSRPPDQFKSELYTYQAQAEDPDGDILTYRLDEAPGAMDIDSYSGEIRWPISAADAGSHMVRVVAEDEEGMQAVQEYTVEIAVL